MYILHVLLPFLKAKQDGSRSKRCNPLFRVISGEREKKKTAKVFLWKTKQHSGRYMEEMKPLKFYNLGDPVCRLTSLTKMATSSSSSVL